MTNARSWIFMAAIVALTLTCFSPAKLQAQSPMSVNVPFEFYVGKYKLPAGRYDVNKLGDPAVLRLSDGIGHTAAVISNGKYNRSVPRTGHLIFTRYGGLHFLSEVHWADSSVSRQVVKSPMEIEIARNSRAERITATNNR